MLNDSVTLLPVKRKPRQKPGEPAAPKRSGKALNVWLDTALRDAIEAASDQSRRTLTEEVSIALEHYLASLGLWPPQQSTTDD